MKAGTVRSSRYISYRRNTYTPYPGAATRRLGQRLLDTVLAAAITMAVIVILLFLLIL